MNRDEATVATAAYMARSVGVDPKRFRAALRSAGINWHGHGERWTVVAGSAEHEEMKRILAGFRTSTGLNHSLQTETKPLTRGGNDETWVIDQCDAVLGRRALRQHRFSFLRGDAGKLGNRASLPVDAFYPELRLVIEYHERQHTQSVPLFDHRTTVSGISRGEQRRRYDDYRRILIPKFGYKLLIFDFSEFAHTNAGRLFRTEKNEIIIQARLQERL